MANTQLPPVGYNRPPANEDFFSELLDDDLPPSTNQRAASVAQETLQNINLLFFEHSIAPATTPSTTTTNATDPFPSFPPIEYTMLSANEHDMQGAASSSSFTQEEQALIAAYDKHPELWSDIAEETGYADVSKCKRDVIRIHPSFNHNPLNNDQLELLHEITPKHINPISKNFKWDLIAKEFNDHYPEALPYHSYKLYRLYSQYLRNPKRRKGYKEELSAQQQLQTALCSNHHMQAPPGSAFYVSPEQRAQMAAQEEALLELEELNKALMYLDPPRQRAALLSTETAQEPCEDTFDIPSKRRRTDIFNHEPLNEIQLNTLLEITQKQEHYDEHTNSFHWDNIALEFNEIFVTQNQCSMPLIHSKEKLKKAFDSYMAYLELFNATEGSNLQPLPVPESDLERFLQQEQPPSACCGAAAIYPEEGAAEDQDPLAQEDLVEDDRDQTLFKHPASAAQTPDEDRRFYNVKGLVVTKEELEQEIDRYIKSHRKHDPDNTIWKAAEDAQLLELYNKHKKHWTHISLQIDTKTPRQCASRMLNQLEKNHNPLNKEQLFKLVTLTMEDKYQKTRCKKPALDWVNITKEFNGIYLKPCELLYSENNLKNIIFTFHRSLLKKQ